MMGYLQDTIIQMGMQKGFVSVVDVARFYPARIIFREMCKLVALGFFRETKDKNGNIIWEYVKGGK